jgi:UDP-glucose 6-dehydrogenase
MCKHALNTFLGLQIAFINEVAHICAAVGADPATVSLALRTDHRVSLKAPLRPGAPFSGGHLARDINTLATFHTPLISHILESNGGQG